MTMTFAKKRTSGLGLESMGDLSALLDTPTTSSGGPLSLDINLIDEDPNQPRTEDNPGFSVESLDELAASIRLRSVKTPISVRINPEVPGRYIINHGARRYRASIRAEKTTIPGFIDNDYNEADQVVENLQRNELTAREIADFIGRELAKGLKKKEIALAISKSSAFVTQHVTLLDLPYPIAVVFSSGRSKDVTVINELVTAHKKNPEAVTDWLGDESQEITRGSVRLLRDFLETKRAYEYEQPDGLDDKNDNEGDQDDDAKEIMKKAEDPSKLKKPIIKIKHNGRPARLIPNRRPSAYGFAWLKYEEDGHEIEIKLEHAQLIALDEG